MHIPDQESRGHIQKTWIYFMVGFALLILTGLTVSASYVNWGVWLGGGFVTNIIVASAIASLKAYLVLMYFMHMRYESSLVWAFGILYPLILFILLLGFTSMDMFLRVIPVPSSA